MADLKSYRYSGPVSGLTTPDGRQVMLHPGKVLELPACEQVGILVERGHLAPVAPPAKTSEKPPKSAPKGGE